MDGRDIFCGQQLLILLQPAFFNDVEINRKTLYNPCKIVAGKQKEADWIPILGHRGLLLGNAL